MKTCCTATAATTLVLTGNALTIPTLINAAQDPTHQILPSQDSLERMRTNRAFAEKLVARGDVVYGLSTGVGVRKKHTVEQEKMIQFQERMVREHATGQGPPLDPIVVRASAIVLLNSLCAGRTNVRPEIAERISARLCDAVSQPLRSVPMYGTTGMGDVTPLAHITRDLVYLATQPTSQDSTSRVRDRDRVRPPSLSLSTPIKLIAGEALPLIAQSSVVTAHAALALHETRILLEQMTVLAALDIEGYAANPAPYHSLAGSVRPYPGHQHALRLLRQCLLKGELASTPNNQQRHLQAPLTFRTAAGVLGAAYDALTFCSQQVSIELNAHQQNPLSLAEEDRMVSSGHFEMQALSQAMDIARLAVAPCLTTQIERSVKMLQGRDTGLTDGLAAPEDDGALGHGFSEILWPLQAMGVEARLLAVQPVSAELGSSAQAEGVEDRLTMAGLSARRLRQFVRLASRCLAISATIACQAIDLRQCRLSPTLRKVHESVRQHVTKMAKGDPPPSSLDSVVKGLTEGTLLRVKIAEQEGGTTRSML